MRVECDMTKEQMFATLQSMLERITDSEWADWQAQIADDAEYADPADCLAAREAA